MTFLWYNTFETNILMDTPIPLISGIAHAASSIMEVIPASEAEAELHPLVHGLDSVSVVSAAIIGYVGVGIMLYGCARGLMLFVRNIITHKNQLARVRIDLGKHLALGLDFFVGKDIIESVVHPTWDDLGKLGVIILIRTVVSIFLTRELKEVEEEIKIEQSEIKLLKKMEKAKA